MSDTKYPPFACPSCGGDLQLTIKVWLTLDPETGAVSPGFSAETVGEPEVYCENDCEIPEVLNDDDVRAKVEGARLAVDALVTRDDALKEAV